MSNLIIDIKYIRKNTKPPVHGREPKPRPGSKFVGRCWRWSEDKDSSKHYQRNNPDAERQQLTGNALEIARSRALVVHCHDDLPYAASAQRPLRAMPAQQVHADTALRIVRAHRAAVPLSGHQMHQTSDV